MTKDEYLTGVVTIIKECQKPGQPLKASTLGNLILSRLHERWNQHSYLTLKPLLEDLERLGKIKLVHGLPGGISVETVDIRPSLKVEATRPRRLRPEVWLAFVNELPDGVRVLHRETGEVRTGLPGAPNNDAKWIFIHRIPDETFKDLARSLIDEKNTPQLREVLGDRLWFVKLSQEMRRVAAWMVPLWSRLRSQHVFNTVEQWCTVNGIPLTMVIENPLAPAEPKGAAPIANRSTDDALRSRILEALGRMSLDELLEIPIPSKYTMRDSAR